MIITFSGHNGSGKTHVSREVAKRLGYERWSIGDINREHAKELGLTISEYDLLYEDDPSLDEKRDEMTRRRGLSEDDLVVDARAAWHFIPHSFKIFLTASDDERAQRLFGRQENAEKDYLTADEALAVADERAERFRQRLISLYGIDVYDPENFDLVIDTTDMSAERVIQRVLDALDQL